MAKTYKNLYPQIYDYQDLYAAYLKARKGKRYKTQVFPVGSRGVDFLGWRIWATHRLLRTTSKKRILKRLNIARRKREENQISEETLQRILNSIEAHCSHGDTYRFIKKSREHKG